MYEIIYYDKKGWQFYDDNFKTLEKANKKALELSSFSNLEFVVIKVFSHTFNNIQKDK